MSRREQSEAADSQVSGAATVRQVAVKLTRNTFAYGALLVALWYAALSQGNGAAYALFFFIVTLGIVSWLHARRNLRGLTLRAGLIEPVFAGGNLHVPVTITAGSGNFAAGLEIRALPDGETVRSGFIPAGETLDVSLLLPASRRGARAILELELRSLWPFGLFSPRARVTLEAPHHVQPAPHGTQPLPSGEPGWQYDRRKGRGDGDEFAGLREFRVGENPRRIHWRTAERSGKLLMQEWEGASGGLRWLDWKAVEAGDAEARLAQLARWILDADRSGTPYGLRLPGVEIPPALGPAHRARCLQALAIFPGAAADIPRKKQAPYFDRPILPGPFAGLLIALALSALPILTTVLPFSAGLFGVAILFRLLTRKRGMALRSLPAKLLVIGAGVGGVLLSGGGLLGLQPGTSLLVGLIALKILESATRRDFFVLVLLSWFLALCGLFVSQSLIAGAGATLLCCLAAATSAVLYSEDQIPWRLALKRTGFIALQGMPLIALFFLFFPRVQGGFRLSLNPGGVGVAGFSENFDPGDFTKLNDNFDTAFRAEFLDGTAPQPSDRYWRGLVLWECDGLEWRRGPMNIVEPRILRPPAGAFRHRITLQPHGARWLFALDRPLFPARESTLEAGGFLQAFRPINHSIRYEVVSLPRVQDKVLPKQHRAAGLLLPGNIPPRTRALGESWRKGENDAAIVRHGVQWFQAQGFTYNLSPDRYRGANALDEFLFQRRTGFCSHYASAFATLMRIAGVPARVVLGYQGGEYNPHGQYFLVRQNDAHAWCEVWIEGHGWQRVDLTQQLAPSRIEAGAEGFRDAAGNALGGVFRSSAGLYNLFGKVRLLWDNLNYQWDVRVVAFDEDAQFEFLASVGLKDIPRPLLLGGIFAAACVLLGLAGLWLRRTTRPTRDPIAETWSRICREIARISGVSREAWEGPCTYAERAANTAGESAPEIRAAGDLYAKIRFGAAPPALTNLKAVAEQLRLLKPKAKSK